MFTRWVFLGRKRHQTLWNLTCVCVSKTTLEGRKQNPNLPLLRSEIQQWVERSNPGNICPHMSLYPSTKSRYFCEFCSSTGFVASFKKCVPACRLSSFFRVFCWALARGLLGRGCRRNSMRMFAPSARWRCGEIIGLGVRCG